MLGTFDGLLENYYLSSNGESRAGYYDLRLVPKFLENQTAIIMEFKRFASDEAGLEKAVQEGLRRLNKRRITPMSDLSMPMLKKSRRFHWLFIIKNVEGVWLTKELMVPQ